MELYEEGCLEIVNARGHTLLILATQKEDPTLTAMILALPSAPKINFNLTKAANINRNDIESDTVEETIFDSALRRYNNLGGVYNFTGFKIFGHVLAFLEANPQINVSGLPDLHILRSIEIFRGKDLALNRQLEEKQAIISTKLGELGIISERDITPAMKAANPELNDIISQKSEILYFIDFNNTALIPSNAMLSPS